MLVNVAEREVQRILLELLNEMDGFDQHVNVKIRMYIGIIKWWGLVPFNPWIFEFFILFILIFVASQNVAKQQSKVILACTIVFDFLLKKSLTLQRYLKGAACTVKC